MIYLSIFLNVTLIIILFFVSRFALKMAKIVMRVEDSIEENLDILDSRYESMSKILEKPIFFDSPEVRQVIEDIGRSRDAILYIANSLTLAIDSEAVIDSANPAGEDND